MPHTDSDGPRIYFETHGSPQDPALLLVCGVGSQLTAYRETFFAPLVEAGLYVIRADNRDGGLSDAVDVAPAIEMFAAVEKSLTGEDFPVPYTLSDMADDMRRVLDAAGVDKAHVLGCSMGGMIAQRLAIAHPGRTLSLTSVMSTTGRQDVSFPTPEALGALLAPAGDTRESAIKKGVEAARVLRGPGVAFDEEEVWAEEAAFFDRAFHPDGFGRQFLALLEDRDKRRDQLATLDVPTLVIHGALDPLVPVAAAHDTHEVVPRSRLLVLDEMGHHLSPPFFDAIHKALREHLLGVSTR